MVNKIVKNLIEAYHRLNKKERNETDLSFSPLPSFHKRFSNEQLLHLERRYGGKILTRNEIDLNDEDLSLLLPSYFEPIRAIESNYLQTICRRCNNEDLSLFAKIPCHRCQKTHVYCRNCIQMGRIMECDSLYIWKASEYSWSKYERPLTWNGELTIAQQQAADRIVQAVLNNSELLVWAVTGAGKTEMLFPGINKALQLGKRICIATPRVDVVRELTPRLKKAFQNVPIQSLYGGSNDKDGSAQFIISTTHQLLRYYQAFDVLIIDEIDAFPYHQDKTLPFAAKRAMKRNAAIIYLTATPRIEQKRLMRRGKLPHVFVPLRYHGYPLPIPKTIYCPSLKKKLSRQILPKQFINWLINRDKKSRQILIFVSTIELTRTIQPAIIKICKDLGIVTNHKEVEFVHAEDKQREEKINQFRYKKIKVMITTTILERGVTFPEIDVAVLDASHEVFDDAALVQIAGRAGRSKLDPTGEVIFFHDGKTNAIMEAIAAIKQMNDRGEKMRSKGVT